MWCIDRLTKVLAIPPSADWFNSTSELLADV